MGIRLVFNPYESLVNSITQDRQAYNSDLQQVDSGQKLNSLSDDPAAVGEYVNNKFEAAQLDQFTQTISGVQGSIQAADSALNAVGESLTSAISLAVNGSNGTLSTQQRQALATQAQNIQQQVLSLANSEFQGVYLFGGTKSASAPYTQSGSAVTYNGDNNSNTVEVAPGVSVKTNLPGSAVFNQSGADVFQALQDLVTALQSGNSTQVGNVTQELNAAANNVGVQRSNYDFALSQVQTSSTIVTADQTQLTQQQSTLIDADPAEAITNLEQAQTTLQAALSAGGKMSQDSLLNYLPQP